ncbi:MAG TPA: type II toxin-antitoxin system VapC family toxin [Verrucomicrobiae bacterium]|nr:type II toxin-antitoxin system VapC family toxin [Verrucomicrobiae bacterium]
MILDTNAVSALFVGDNNLARVLSGSPRHQLPVIVLGEYRYGLKRSRHPKALESLLDQLERESDVLPIDADTAAVYADVRDQLRRRGTPLPENDVWIAALALQYDQPIISQDQHFDLVPRLRRLGW